MSLDVDLLGAAGRSVYKANITHNLTDMAEAAGIYSVLWRPDENGITKADQLIKPLRAGLAKLEDDPEFYMTFDSPNGFGKYVDFVPFVRNYLLACENSPDATVEVSR